MSKLKEWLLIGMVALVAAASLGSDCNFTLRADEDGIRFNVDDDDNNNDLEDFFDDIEDLFD